MNFCRCRGRVHAFNFVRTPSLFQVTDTSAVFRKVQQCLHVVKVLNDCKLISYQGKFETVLHCGHDWDTTKSRHNSREDDQTSTRLPGLACHLKVAHQDQRNDLISLHQPSHHLFSMVPCGKMFKLNQSKVNQQTKRNIHVITFFWEKKPTFVQVPKLIFIGNSDLTALHCNKCKQ